jgi:hypothetical protein
MVNFNPLPKELLDALWPYQKQFQALLAFTANKILGADTSRIRGIGKYEGGVTVNNCEIYISRNVLMDDWKRTAEPTPEEKATADAMEIIIAKIDPSNPHEGLRRHQNDIGMPDQQMELFLVNPYACDPLRSLFGKW